VLKSLTLQRFSSVISSPDKNKKKQPLKKLFAQKDMNKNEIVSLLKKNIDELILLTDGFYEMETIPAAILNLAQGKTEDIRNYIDMLGVSDNEKINVTNEIKEVENVKIETEPEPVISEIPAIVEKEIVEPVIPAEMIVEQTPAAEIKTEIPVTEEKIEIIVEEITSTEIIVEDNTVTEIITEEIKTEITREENKTKTLGEKLSQNSVSRNDMLSKKESGGIHASIANQKITDIRQAISLGDRFRFQRELFRNNGEEMNKMLTYLNMLATYDEAIAFLITKYGWQEDNPAALDFYQIIKRKF
jgi:hypothetical protein